MAEFHHIGLTVADIEASYTFYTQVVGMTEWDQARELDVVPAVTEHKDEGTGPGFITNQSEEFDQLADQSGTELKYIMLVSKDGSFVFQLIQYLAGGTGALELEHSTSGSLHLSFFVDDVEEKWAEVQRRGDVKLLSDGVVDITPSMRSFYVYDPDGVPVEFLQVIRTRKTL
jgi:catechol 2,3-dioxygenase-like lactoylglutathione lyase family enzyme